MGAAASVGTKNELPALLDKDQVRALVGDQFEEQKFEVAKDEAGKVSRDAVIEAIEQHQEASMLYHSATAHTTEWTSEDDAALMKAHDAVPKSLGKNKRWKEIAKAVGSGHGKHDCRDRYNILRQRTKHAKRSEEADLRAVKWATKDGAKAGYSDLSDHPALDKARYSNLHKQSLSKMEALEADLEDLTRMVRAAKVQKGMWGYFILVLQTATFCINHL